MPAILIIRNNIHYKNVCKLLLYYYNREKNKNSNNKYISDLIICYVIHSKMYVDVSFIFDSNVRYYIHDNSIIQEYVLLSLLIENELHKFL